MNAWQLSNQGSEKKMMLDWFKYYLKMIIHFLLKIIGNSRLLGSCINLIIHLFRAQNRLEIIFANR